MKKNIIFPLLAALMLLTGCYDDGVHGDSYYVFTGKTIGSVLDNNPNYAKFDSILSKAGVKSLLSTYGSYTCLAPTNAAIDEYFDTYYPGKSLNQLDDSVVTAIAESHIIEKQYLTSDLSTGYLSTPNMYKRQVQVDISKVLDAVAGDSVTVYLFNGKSKIVEANDTVSNGVLHGIDHVLEQSNFALPDYMKSLAKENGFTLFMEALEATKLTDLMRDVKDESEDMKEALASCKSKLPSGQSGYSCKAPTERKFGFTVFVEKDDLLRNIYDPEQSVKPIFTGDATADLKSLFNYAKSIYDPVFPEDAGKYDDDYTNPKNPLYRYMAYHVLNRNLGYNKLVGGTKECPEWNVNEGGDFVEYYETLEGDVMRLQMVSKAGNGIYINRCSRSGNVMNGSMVLSSGGLSTENGNFQFLNAPIAFSQSVVNMLSTERIRIDSSSLLPELDNNSIHYDDDKTLAEWHFPHNYFSGIICDAKTDPAYVRWEHRWDGRNPSLLDYHSDVMYFYGEYDVTFRLPALPAGQYEIRIGHEANKFMGISQIYFGYDTKLMSPVGIPVNMNQVGSDAEIGMLLDSQLEDDTSPTWSSDRYDGKKTLVSDDDRRMRNMGFMKGPKAMYRVKAGDHTTREKSAVEDRYYFRRIITTEKLQHRPFYLRFRKVDSNTADNMRLNIDFFEICPRSVYNGSEKEDRY